MTPGLSRYEAAAMTDTPAVRHRSWLAWAVIAAQLLFVGAMLILGAIEGHAYQRAGKTSPIWALPPRITRRLSA